MKVAVYTICRDEEKHVARFMASTRGADGVFALDTGSSDGTIAAIAAAGAIVVSRPLHPFRFDVARNLALHIVPGEYEACLVLDLDEVLIKGWREKLQSAWRPGETTSALCQVISSRDSRGNPDTVYWGKRVHSRSGWYWRYPAHVLVTPFIPEAVIQWRSPAEGVQIEHLPDREKSREDRLRLLELGVKENLHEARCSHYLGREYFYRGKLDQAERELRRHLTLDRGAWYGDRAASMRFLGWIERRKGNLPGATAWFLRECAEAAGEREPWVDLAQAYYDVGNHAGCYFAAKQALAIAERPRNCITYGYAWGDRPYDLASLAAWRLGHKAESLRLAEQALALAPDKPRLKANVGQITQSLST